jgi:F-type H+-transporting ATPase subunit delta
MDTRAAHRYALALLDIGEKTGVSRFSADFDAIAQTLHDSRELRALLNSPVVKPEAKLRVLTEIFSKQVSADTMAFVTLLVHKKREGLLADIITEFKQLLETQQGMLRANVKSAVNLNDAERQAIIAKLEGLAGKKLTTDFTVDPSIRGGFVARIGDTLIDASLQHQLEMLREQFKRGGAAVLN